MSDREYDKLEEIKRFFLIQRRSGVTAIPWPEVEWLVYQVGFLRQLLGEKEKQINLAERIRGMNVGEWINFLERHDRQVEAGEKMAEVIKKYRPVIKGEDINSPGRVGPINEWDEALLSWDQWRECKTCREGRRWAA